MKQELHKRTKSHTIYIQLDTKKCVACWQCQEVCSNDVIGKINILWHKHVRFVNADNCIGCLKCIKVCTSNALTRIESNK